MVRPDQDSVNASAVVETPGEPLAETSAISATGSPGRNRDDNPACGCL